MTKSILSFESVSFGYGLESQPLIRDFNLEVYEGDFLVLLGSNGSGKSTLFKLVQKKISPKSGNFLFDGKVKDIAVVNQDLELTTFSDLTVFENCLLAQGKFPWFFKQNLKNEIQKKIADMSFELSMRLDEKVNCLSGGQRQTLALCMAFLKKPKLLLLDEHTSALDPKIGKSLLEWTYAKVSELKITTLMITHDLDDALKFSNRILMLQKGKSSLNLSAEEKINYKKEDLMMYY